MKRKIIPHFVADRQMSLRILSGLDFTNHNVKVGLMTQANTSKSFRLALSKFPCLDLQYCGVIDGPCPYDGDISCCSKGKAVKSSFTTISDSGVFTKDGCLMDYKELFNRYEEMGVERGIMIDFLGKRDKTVRSAKKALEVYGEKERSFKLIGVAQGKTSREYLACYNQIKDLGFEEVAIGGLLTKLKNTARYSYTRDDKISRIVKAIKEEWPSDRCFTLGVYNPSRHDLLQSLGVDCADYKGWIFQYNRHFKHPLYHHIDRCRQTREFVEKTILAKLSGKTFRKIPISTVFDSSINCLDSFEGKVIVNPTLKDSERIKRNILKRVTVISCGKIKVNKTKCVAKDAYLGRSFVLKKQFAESSGNPWFILSAKYGLIRPSEVINPRYDQTIETKKDQEKLMQKITKQVSLYSEMVDADDILFLGPEAYANSLVGVLSDTYSPRFVHVTKGMKQGELQKFIKEYIEQLGGYKEIEPQINQT